MPARDLTQETKWRGRIEECRQSGLSIKAWCQQNGLKDTAYHYWVKRFKFLDLHESGGNKFAEVVLPESNNARLNPRSAKLSLTVGNYTIGIEDGFNPHTLVELLKILKKL